ncbi:hypothetical protein [Pseudomonas abietaniphila]|uniref:Uncharacterized protein n=1 Tax=Pseudomonas abietaniphila TaxID=89065 RepID=A0A1G8LM45_9PSED|nr:hypothetical protein [Pseudomonas abietaniphila]SDI56695.1 hypothetical protein SAMN05216605_114187 [Pseudomonas abietaniphila]
MEKTAAAKHSAAYRARQAEAKQKMGIEKMPIEVPIGTRSAMSKAMDEHGYSQVQELWQDLALSFLSMPHEEQARRLRKPDALAFVITSELARNYVQKAKAELKSNPGDEIILSVNR